MADTLPGNKTMVNSAGNSPEKGRTVEVALDIHTNPLEAKLGADAYADFPSSQTMSYETYSDRMDALSTALGNKDSVKG